MKTKLTLISLAAIAALILAIGQGTPDNLAKWSSPATLNDARIIDKSTVMSIAFESNSVPVISSNAVPDVSGIVNSHNIVGVGGDALDRAVMDDASGVLALGVGALKDSRLQNQSGNIVALGRLSMYGANFDNASQIFGFGAASLYRAKLTNTSDFFAIGNGAGFDLSGTFDHVFLAGSGAQPTGDNQWVAGDARYNYKFPGPSAEFAGPVTILSATNQVTFGATNSPPADKNHIATWVSVQVAGDTNAYRLPLYK